jgi:hypothetical protein
MQARQVLLMMVTARPADHFPRARQLIEPVSTDDTRYQRISHQCLRLLGNFLGNSKNPTALRL